MVLVIGNAALPGVGYLVQRRFKAAAIAAGGAAVLLVPLVHEPGTRLWPTLLALWWASILLHSLASVRGQTRGEFIRPARRSPSFWTARWAVLALAAIMLFAAYLVRVDAGRIIEEASQTHRDGDCSQARATLGRLNTAHGIAANGAAGTAAEQLEACRILAGIAEDTEPDEEAEILDAYLDHPGARWTAGGIRRAELLLTMALTGGDDLADDTDAALSQLDRTLRQDPSLEGQATELLTSFRAGFDMEARACTLLELNELLAAADADAEALRTVIDEAADQLPALMVDCAKDAVAAQRFDEGIDQYQRFLETYPDHELAAQVQEELDAAETARAQAQEHAEITSLLSSGAWCADPTGFSQAAAYVGIQDNAVWVSGTDEVVAAFPDELRTQSAREATAVVCVTGPERGSLLETCEYLVYFGADGDLEYYATEFRVEVFELRTGERVDRYTEEFGGSCPEEIEYEYSLDYDTFPDNMEAPYDAGDLESLFDRLR
jgi:tetratricopeptide (TPR) repeat protein